MDAAAFQLDMLIFVAFVLFCYLQMKPHSARDAAQKPQSAWQLGADRRVLQRHGIEGVPEKLLQSSLQGFLAIHFAAYGFRSLLPRRKEPIDM